ncbi:MAG: hypothetical protein ACJ0BL_03800 [Dehalococcoidia bacterium]
MRNVTDSSSILEIYMLSAVNSCLNLLFDTCYFFAAASGTLGISETELRAALGIE